MKYSNQSEETIKVARRCPFSILKVSDARDLEIYCARRDVIIFNFTKAEKVLKENLTDKELVHLASKDIDTSALRYCGIWAEGECFSYCIYEC